MNITHHGWLALTGDSDVDASAPVGGDIAVFTAGAQTLNVGDAVYVSAVNTVDKSATATNYAGFIGFVVGGAATDMQPRHTVGISAALTGQKVLVQISGIANAIVGATGFTAGTNFSAVPSAATAGRIIPGTTAGQMLGTAVSTQATAGAAVKILIRHR